MEQELASSTKQRKEDHIHICLELNVQSQVGPGFDDLILVHQSVPETNFSDMKTEIELFGKTLKAPIIVEGMTGGTEQAEKINKTISKACQKAGIGMGVGSQRAMIEDPALAASYDVRTFAPDILLFANLGLPQFILGYTNGEAETAVAAIEADGLAIHLNPLQEAVQPEGDAVFESGISVLKALKKECDFPVIAKETGAGISREAAEALSFLDGLDVGGVGGTSFSAVEYYRNTGDHKEIASEFWNWGITTAVSIVECRSGSAKSKPLIASGGIRTGIDIAKAIALGADCCGIALPVLKAAVKGETTVTSLFNKVIYELKIAMFLCGCSTISELKKAPLVITGKTREFLKERGYKTELFARR